MPNFSLALVALLMFVGTSVFANTVPATQPAASGEVTRPMDITIKPSKEAFAWLPMSIREQHPDPTSLATAFEESIRKDPSGKTRIRGTNSTPNDFATAMKIAGTKDGKVPFDGLDGIPAYLRSLGSKAMPDREIRMSRIGWQKDVVGRVSFKLDVKEGFKRKGTKGEYGWYDPNTGLLILAGDCANSPLDLTELEPAPQGDPLPRVAGVPGIEFTPRKPSKPLCATKWFQVNIWDSAALGVPGVSEAILAAKSVPKERVGDEVFAPNRVSRMFGAEFRRRHDTGFLARGKSMHQVQIVLKKGEVEYSLTGDEPVSMTGVYRIELPADWNEATDVVIIRFGDYAPLASPVNSGIHAKHSELVAAKIDCGETFHVHAIDAPAAAQ